MAKATHTGTCQVCGARQRLPDGRLAKHGYSVRYGFFEGVCYGAGHLPFEQDTSLIEEAIRLAEERALNLDAQAAVESDPATVTGFYREVYRGRHKHWERFPFDGVEVERDGGIIRRIKVGEYRRSEFAYGRTLEEIAAKENSGNYGYMLRSRARDAREYVIWQRKRLEGWTPGELVPVEEG